MTLPLAALLQGAVAGGPTGQTYVDDVFQTVLWDNSANTYPRSVNSGLDMTKGGLYIEKGRTGGNWHWLDTDRGGASLIQSNSTSAAGSCNLTFTSTGITHNSSFSASVNNQTASYFLRKAPKFFDVVTYTGTGSSQTISHSLNQTVGVLVIKRISGTGNWATFARTGGAAGATQYAYFNTSAGLNLTAAAGATGFGAEAAGFITSTGFKPNDLSGSGGAGDADNINENGATYVAYLFAHDTSTDGIIQCGSFTTDGSGNATVNLGWEPQWLLYKSTATSSWDVVDSSRGLLATGNTDARLHPNLADAENLYGSVNINATGFKTVSGGIHTSETYIYLAIRRPNKPPTTGTQVYNAIARTGTGATATVTGVGFAPDLVIPQARNGSNNRAWWFDRLRGKNIALSSNLTNAEITRTDQVMSFDMDGVSFGADGGGDVNASAIGYINHFFRRAPGVHDQICYTGTGSNKTESHTMLGVAPELWLVKMRSATGSWVFGSSLLTNTEKIVMPSPNGKVTDATAWNSTYPTATTISLGTSTDTNASGATHTCWMWATKPGISKVFSYTGDGGSGKVIDCGFTAGARFIMIIRTTASTAQDIFIWDSARGIVAANDPHLSLNTTAAEVTTDDSVDPDNSGFAINQVAATNINVNGAVYIGLAFS